MSSFYHLLYLFVRITLNLKLWHVLHDYLKSALGYFDRHLQGVSRENKNNIICLDELMDLHQTLNYLN